MTLVRNPLGFKTISQLQPGDQTLGQTFLIVQLKVLRNYTGQCRKWSTIDQQIAQKFGPLSSKKRKKKKDKGGVEEQALCQGQTFWGQRAQLGRLPKTRNKKIRKSCSC